MGTFTLTLKKVIELTGGTVDMGGSLTVMSGGNIGLNSYPIFDEAHREILNGKIIDHFWNYEIAHESVDIFQMRMRVKMNEIMPYYNQLYVSERIKFDPLSTVNLKNTGKSEQEQDDNRTTDSNSKTDNESKSRSVSSDTPQTMLSGNGDYASSAADSNAQGNATASADESSTGHASGTSSTESTTSGYQGIPAELIMRARETFLNIDLAVISNLETLFMLVLDNGDDYAPTNRRYYL